MTPRHKGAPPRRDNAPVARGAGEAVKQRDDDANDAAVLAGIQDQHAQELRGVRTARHASQKGPTWAPPPGEAAAIALQQAWTGVQ